jgi:hypothetical protein
MMCENRLLRTFRPERDKVTESRENCQVCMLRIIKYREWWEGGGGCV